MLRTLLESRSRRTGTGTGTAASAGVHLLLIVLAVYATASGASATPTDDPPSELHWIEAAPADVTSSPSSQAAAAEAPAARHALPRSVSLNIPVGVPDVSIPLAAVRQNDFGPSTGSVSAPDDRGSSAQEAGKMAYDSYEVDRQVSAVAGSAPEYPASLRAAGVEGEVRAQFVVDDHGRADGQSLRILSSTNALFEEAVRRALPRMRFIPARIGARAVAQTVQQSFVFRLDR